MKTAEKILIEASVLVLQQEVKRLLELVDGYKSDIRNETIEEVAQHVEKLKGFGQDTVSSLAIYIREMKK